MYNHLNFMNITTAAYFKCDVPTLCRFLWDRHGYREKHGLNVMAEFARIYKTATEDEINIFDKAITDLQSIERKCLEAYEPWQREQAEVIKQAVMTREVAEDSFGIGFGRLLQLKEYEPAEFLSKLKLFTETFTHLEKNFCPQDELGKFINTFCEIVRLGVNEQMLISYSLGCNKLSDEDLPIHELSKAFLDYSSRVKIPEQYRLCVSYGSIEKELSQSVDAVLEDERKIRAEEKEQERKDKRH